MNNSRGLSAVLRRKPDRRAYRPVPLQQPCRSLTTTASARDLPRWCPTPTPSSLTTSRATTPGRTTERRTGAPRRTTTTSPAKRAWTRAIFRRRWWPAMCYQLPIGRGKAVGSGMSRIADAVVGGWELSGIATFRDGIPLERLRKPVELLRRRSQAGCTFPANPKPAHQKISSTVPNSWANVAAFAYAPYGSFGNAPRYHLTTSRDPITRTGIALLRRTGTFERTMRAQFRFETFNSFNHPNFYAPGPGNMSLYSPAIFGEITRRSPAESSSLPGKFYW